MSSSSAFYLPCAVFGFDSLCVFMSERCQDFFPVEGRNKSVVFPVFWPCPNWMLKKDNWCRCIISVVLFLLGSLLCFFLHKPPGMVHTHTAACVMPFLPLGLWRMQGPFVLNPQICWPHLSRWLAVSVFLPFHSLANSWATCKDCL